EFESPETLLAAARRVREAGYRRIDACVPFPVEGLTEALGFRRTGIPLLVLAGALSGAAGAYFMQWYAMGVWYPLNVGGRPLNSWPLFIPITFELAVLVGGLTAVLGMLALNRLPTPYHPLFNVPRATRSPRWTRRAIGCRSRSRATSSRGGTSATTSTAPPATTASARAAAWSSSAATRRRRPSTSTACGRRPWDTSSTS